MSVRFPSLAFLQALRAEMRGAQERFSRLGFFDTTFGVRVLDAGGTALFEGALGFEVFDCVLVREGLEGVTPDFVLEGPLPAWREMLDAIHRLGAADAAHGHDKLYRFAESIQEFFDLSAGIDFVYPDGASPPTRAEPARRSGT